MIGEKKIQALYENMKNLLNNIIFLNEYPKFASKKNGKYYMILVGFNKKYFKMFKINLENKTNNFSYDLIKYYIKFNLNRYIKENTIKTINTKYKIEKTII